MAPFQYCDQCLVCFDILQHVLNVHFGPPYLGHLFRRDNIFDRFIPEVEEIQTSVFPGQGELKPDGNGVLSLPRVDNLDDVHGQGDIGKRRDVLHVRGGAHLDDLTETLVGAIGAVELVVTPVGQVDAIPID